MATKRKATKRKPAARKKAAKKTTARKKTASKAPAKRKSTARKTTARKTARKKTSARSASAKRKPAAKKAAKKTAAGKATPAKAAKKVETKNSPMPPKKPVLVKPKNSASNQYTQSELYDCIQNYCGFTSRKEAKEFYEKFAGMLHASLKGGIKVPLPGLGKLQVRKTKARMGINPATREPIKIPAKKKVAFTANKALKEAVL